MVHRVVDIHFQGVDRKLGHKAVTVKAAQHICTLQHGEFGLFDLIVLPAGGSKLFFGDLKGVPQQGVILVQIVGLQITHGIIFGGIHEKLPLF